MALLLMAGLALVPEDLLKAATMDGATAWQRFCLITRAADEAGHPGGAAVPHPGRLPDLRQHLHPDQRRRTSTGSVSILGYDNLFRALNLGIGSAISVLIFICVAIIAFIFIKLFGAAAPGRGRREADGRHDEAEDRVGHRQHRRDPADAHPGLWIVSLSFKDPAPSPRQTSSRPSGPGRTTAGSSDLGVHPGADQLDRHRPDRDLHRGGARHRWPPTPSPGSTSPARGRSIGMSLLIAMFPPISLVTPLFNIERSLGLFDTWPGLIIPYITFALPLAIYTLSAFFREIPWDLEKAAKMDGATPFQAFRRVIAPLAAPGMFTTAILVFIFCWNDFLFAISLTSTIAARTVPAAIAFFTGSSQFEEPTGSIAAAAVVITIPIIIFVLLFQRRIVAGLTSGAVKG